MMRTILIPAALAALLALTASPQVHAYGAVHRSATYTNPNTGRTVSANSSAAYGPNGAYRTGSVSGSGPNGAYSGTKSSVYSPSMYGGYSGAGGASAYGASVVRYP